MDKNKHRLNAADIITLLRIAGTILLLFIITAAVKYRMFSSLHTYLNKATGIAVFLIPFSIVTDYAVLFCFAVCAVAAASSLEELVIHIFRKNYCPNVKSVFRQEKINENEAA